MTTCLQSFRNPVLGALSHINPLRASFFCVPAMLCRVRHFETTRHEALPLSRADIAVLLFTAAYMVGFTIYFLSIGNHEFIWYIATMLVLIALVAMSRNRAAYPQALLWALTIWGLAHMAGGGLRVGDGVLYSLVLLPLTPPGELTILKYDQVVHAYGFGVTAWLLWHLLNRSFPLLKGTKTLYVFPVLASMGLGALNEIIEFIAVVVFPNTNVGGYYNTALDLVFNTLGAIAAMLIVRATASKT